MHVTAAAPATSMQHAGHAQTQLRVWTVCAVRLQFKGVKFKAVTTRPWLSVAVQRVKTNATLMAAQVNIFSLHLSEILMPFCPKKRT